jgi:hypothetical protein
VSAPEQVTTEDLRTGMRVTVGDATVTVTAITPVGRGARVEFSDGPPRPWAAERRGRPPSEPRWPGLAHSRQPPGPPATNPQLARTEPFTGTVRALYVPPMPGSDRDNHTPQETR